MSDTILNILSVLTKFSPTIRRNRAPPLPSYDADDFDDDDEEENDGGSSAGRGAECPQ